MSDWRNKAVCRDMDPELFSVLFFALVVCLGWAEATAETQQTFDLEELK